MRKLTTLLAITWLCLSLACNFPIAAQTPPAPSAQGSPPTSLPPSPSLTLASPIDPPPSTQTEAPVIPGATPAAPWAFPGLSTATSDAAATPLTSATDPDASILYYTQSGDTLAAVARHFGVSRDQITSRVGLPANGLITPGQALIIPNVLGAAQYNSALLPDSEVVDSPSTADFNIQAFIDQTGGFLSTYRQQFKTEKLSGAEIVRKVVENTSINPRLLLAVLELHTNWVYGQPAHPNLNDPLGFNVPEYAGLYLELALAARMLNTGYYGWREGSLVTLQFRGGKTSRVAAQLNAGTVAVQYLFAGYYSPAGWQAVLYGKDGLAQLYSRMFGDPWKRAAVVEPLFPAGLQPPSLELPFAFGDEWSLTGGPHPVWNDGTPWGALDFAPMAAEAHCAVSHWWVLASAPGRVIRSAYNTVQLELDGEGGKPSGWVLLYMHIAQKDAVALGAHLNANDLIGHPSCEGGDATGTHVHLARKYRGEWVGAGEPLPFVLSGWTAQLGAQPYLGGLVDGDQVVTADGNAAACSRLTR